MLMYTLERVQLCREMRSKLNGPCKRTEISSKLSASPPLNILLTVRWYAWAEEHITKYNVPRFAVSGVTIPVGPPPTYFVSKMLSFG